jgi:predicted DNA-binding protein (MmcQ/YjbR family)
MKLIFKMKYADKKWADYIEEVFGEKVAKECKIESMARAKTHDARIHIMNFKKDNDIISKLKQNENVISAFLVNNNKVVETIC